MIRLADPERPLRLPSTSAVGIGSDIRLNQCHWQGGGARRFSPFLGSDEMKIVVGFSGGVDSQATALLARQQHAAKDVILLNSDAGGNEHPLTTAFIQEYSRTIFPVVMVSPKISGLEGIGTRDGQVGQRRKEYDENGPMTFADLAYIKGRFPSRKAQFCTQHLKLTPSLRWINENIRCKGIEFERWAGVRRDESEKRRDTPMFDMDDFFDCIIRYPVANWTKPQVFAFLKQHGEPINPLYMMGFNRVGCAPCVNSGKGDIRNWAARFPEMIDKVRAWEKKVGRTFFHPAYPALR